MKNAATIIKSLMTMTVVCSLLAYKKHWVNEGYMYCTNRNGVCENKIKAMVCPEGTNDPCENGSNKLYIINGEGTCIEVPRGNKFCKR